MNLFDTIRFRLRALTEKRELEAKLDDELRFHIERETAENLKRGMTPTEARRVALAEFGGVERFKEELRDQRSVRWIDDISGNVRHGFRLLRKNALFSMAVIGTLALGIGATSTIFTIVNSVLLRPVAYANPDRIVSVSQTMLGKDASVVDMTNYAAWRQFSSKLLLTALYGEESAGAKNR